MNAVCLIIGLATGTAHYDDHVWTTDACGVVAFAESEDSRIVTLDGFLLVWPNE